MVYFKLHIQGIDSHAEPLLNPDGTVRGSWGALLVDGGDADADHQPSRQNTIIPWVHCDDDRGCCTHRLTLEDVIQERGV